MPAGAHAVVLGSGLAGLLAARVLADSFDRVSVIERDVLPGGVADRRGVPQGRHIHVLLTRGQAILDELFSGLSAALVADGAVVGDGLAQVRWLVDGHRFARERIGKEGLFLSRALLEHHVRAGVRGLPGVAFVEGCRVLGPTGTAARVTGVRLDGEGREREVEADLVVDATGRGPHPELARRAGAPPTRGGARPGRDRLQLVPLPPGAGGARRRRGRPRHVLSENSRGGGIAALEGGEHIVTLVGAFGDNPPTEPDAFRAWAATLAFPDVHDALQGATPVGEPVPTRFPASIRRRYDRLAAFPAGLLVIGDGVASFNPVYAQGMTVAAMQAVALRDLLRGGRVPAPKEYFRSAMRAVAPAWDIAVGADLVDPRVEGRRTAATSLANAYTARLQAAAEHDVSLAKAFLDVSGLNAPAASLMRPDRMLRVYRAGRRARHEARRG